MVSVLRNRWLLLRLAAGISRADTPRGRVLNALRAVNFVLVTFAFGVLFYALLFFLLSFLSLPFILNSEISTSTEDLILTIVAGGVISFIAVFFAIALTPKLLIFSHSGGAKFKSEVKGYALALAISSAIACVYWLGPAMVSGGGILLSPPELRISVLPLPVVILVNVLLLVSGSVTSWKVRKFENDDASPWVVNGVFFVLMLPFGWLAWYLILAAWS